MRFSPERMRDALCVEYPGVEFFIETRPEHAAASTSCARCAVRAECLEFALDNAIKHGIWGGTSEK